MISKPNIKFSCSYENFCLTRNENPEMCKTCENNTRRNYMEDHFIQAKDEPIPDKHVDAKTHQNCAAHSEGVDYECPICHRKTNSYMSTKICRYCGYRLFL